MALVTGISRKVGANTMTVSCGELDKIGLKSQTGLPVRDTGPGEPEIQVMIIWK